MKTLGRYDLLGELARGGAGVVYRARDQASGAEVALKVLLSGRGATDYERRRFQRETQALAKLSHPNLVTPLDVGEHQGLPYLVMELIPGGTLEERIKTSGPLPPEEAAGLIEQLAEALEHAHQHGVLHRDVKPANVLLDAAGRPRLTDFGLAKDLGASTSALSRSGSYMGTPGFWPPEQAEGKLDQIGPQSDVYALGATLFALLTGEPPFEADDLLSHMHQAVSAPARAPSELRPQVVPALDAICLRCLQKAPADRYPTARALARALHRYARAPAATPPASKPAWPLAVAAALVVVGLAGAGLVVSRGTAAPAPTPVVATPSPTQSASPLPTGPGGGVDRFAEFDQAAQDLNEQAMALAQQQDYESALALLGQAIELEPEFAQAYENRGAIYSILKRFDEALADMDRAVALSPDWRHTLQQRAVVRANSGDHEGAVAELEADLRQRGDDAEVLAELARILASLKQLPRAIAALDRALALEPVQPGPLFFLRLRYHRSLKDYDGMLADYEALLELAPNDGNAAGIHNDRATIYMRTNQPVEALSDFNRAIELGLEEGIVYLNRGQCYLQLNDAQGALLDFERAAEVFGPDHHLTGEVQQRITQARAALAPSAEGR